MTAKIFLVDDDAIQADTRRVILTRAGLSVVVTRSAVEALDKLASDEWLNDIGLVITDHLMPGMNGPEFVSRLRKTAPFLPVLVLSGHPDAEATYKGLDVIFRTKPFPPDQLISLSRALLTAPDRRTA